jgi:hypothetical protein
MPICDSQISSAADEAMRALQRLKQQGEAARR